MDAATAKTTKTGGASKSPAGKNPKPTKKAKGVRKPKKEKTPTEPMVVFAFRLTKAQRDLIHKAAGPAKGTRFVRTAAIAAATLDRAAIDELLATAKSNLKK
jgi:hypothetical protein